MAEIFLCLTGEVMIKYIQTNAAVQVFNKSVDFCKNIFLKSYGIDLDMNNVNSVLYNILKEKGFSSTRPIVRNPMISFLAFYSARVRHKSATKLFACRTLISNLLKLHKSFVG